MNWNVGLVCWIVRGRIDMTTLDLIYAKFVFKLNTEKRMATARKLASLLRNDFTLMNALSRLENIESNNGKKPNEPFAIAMRVWQQNLERGMSFSDATRGWMRDEETLMLTSGNISSLVVALDNLGRVTNGISRIRRAMWGAIAYPLFLLVLTFAIVVMVGVYLVPPLADVAGNDVVWRGMARSLIDMSEFTTRYWHIFAICFVVIVAVVWMTIAHWSGSLRTRFDKLPPWNIYKIQASAGWMMALSALVTGGATVPDALRMLADNSHRYMRDILERTLGFIANGDNLGVALANTNRDFPNSEIIGDLAIYADMTDFDKNLAGIANDYLDESVRKMESISNTLNSVGILLVSAIIAWVVLGTFQMQDQITSVFS